MIRPMDAILLFAGPTEFRLRRDSDRVFRLIAAGNAPDDTVRLREPVPPDCVRNDELAARLRTWIARHGIDRIEIGDPTGFPLSLPLVAQQAGAAAILRVSAQFHLPEVEPARARLLSEILFHADAVAFESSSERALLIAAYPHLIGKSEIVDAVSPVVRDAGRAERISRLTLTRYPATWNDGDIVLPIVRDPSLLRRAWKVIRRKGLRETIAVTLHIIASRLRRR